MKKTTKRKYKRRAVKRSVLPPNNFGSEEENVKALDTPVLTALANTIKQMTYGELIAVAEAMCKMKTDQLETREDFAELLHKWADGQ
jgi:hypothetical protein